MAEAGCSAVVKPLPGSNLGMVSDPCTTACSRGRDGFPWDCHTSVRQSATFSGHRDHRAWGLSSSPSSEAGREMPAGPEVTPPPG